MLDNSSLSVTQPNVFLVPKDKQQRLDWFMDNIKYVMSHYNRKTYFKGEVQANVENPVDKMEKFFRYYAGRQGISDKWTWATMDINKQPLPVVWIGGQKIGTLIDHLDGLGKQMVENMKITVKAISKDTQNKRTELLEAVRTEMFIKKDLAQFAGMGISYSPVGQKSNEFHNTEEAERWVNLDYQEESAIWGGKIANDIYHRNHLAEVAAESLRHTWICGITAMHNYVYNGRVITELIEPMQLIWDNSKGFDQFNRSARFAGFIEYYDPSQVLARYHTQLSDKDKKEIKELSRDNMAQTLSAYLGVRAYMPVGYGIKLSKVTVYWKGRRNLNWKQGTESEWGHKPFYKVKEGDGDYYDECVYQGTLIGNKYLVDCGVAPNQVKDLYNPGESDLPIKVFAPNMVLGETNSIVSKLHQLQDLVDYYTNEIKRVVSRNVGRGFVFDASRFSGPVSPAAFLSDMQNFGIHYANLAKGEPGEVDNNRSKDKLFEVVDMTLDINVQQLAILRAEQERIMESIVNLSPIAMGTQQQYVSSNTQQTSIGQSNISTMAVMKGFTQFMEIVIQNAANMGKIIHSMEDGLSIPVAGARGRDWLKETTAYSHEELGIYIKVLDIIDEQGRLRLQQIALGLAQNQILSFVDWIHVEKAQTYTEIMEYFEMIFKRQERDKKEQQQMALAVQEIEAARQDQANRQSIGGKIAVADKNNAAKLQGKAMDIEAAAINKGIELEAEPAA